MNTFTTPACADFEAILRRTTNCSRYVRNLLDSDAELLPWLHSCYAQPCSAIEITDWLDAEPVTDENSLSRALRKLRKRVMLKILARDLGGLSNLDEVMATMTALAELAVRRAQAFAMASLVEQYGSPTGSSSGVPQEMLVIGMGKLGGGELNVSSDIDLIFVYPEDGETTGARALSNQEFFSKLGRRLINLINDLTGEGYVFRVDMRLRPYGDSGPLVMSFAALEEYLITQGREWERYAWIKARVISPESGSSINELMQLVRPFVFRKYLDFGAFESMRKLHAQIRQEVQRRDRMNNIKLGPGGIREIEFIAQVFQLIRGGRDASLRIRPTLQVLQLLREQGQLRSNVVEQLSAAYIFLRNLEHRLQYLDDQQTQELPQNPDDHARLAEGMGYPDYPSLREKLTQHCNLVSAQFTQIFSTRKSNRQNGVPHNSLWNENVQAEELRDNLGELGYASDLDLIFLYDDPHPDAAEIYARLAQRINTMLGSYTASGRLYETDLRLRPNGASGLMVSSIASFAEYQHQHAWVWEHQALTRARFSAGDVKVGEQFETIRNHVLCQQRDLETLRREIVAMRQKMHDGHPNDSGIFDIKHDRGGMVDIEFMVQFLVLAYSSKHPQLAAHKGNLALLKRAGECGLIEPQQAEAVCNIYRQLRVLQHKMRLNNLTPCRVDADAEKINTAPVLALWDFLLGGL